MRRITVVAIVLLAGAPASASPNVSLDDPVYDRLVELRARGKLPSYVGGLRPLTWHRAQVLLEAAGEPSPGLPSGRAWWSSPIERVSGRVTLMRSQLRPYSTPERMRVVTGGLDVSCEHQEGRPCGDGLGVIGELDSSVGFGQWVSGSVRLRVQTGSDSYATDVALDRAYVNAELGPVALEAGRDILVLGPSSRTHGGWGDHAPALDHVRLSTSRPFDLAGMDGSTLRGNVVYVLGRLRDPQRFSGNVVSIGRAQVDIADTLELGMMQMLQLGGEGAPSFGPADFILEHVRRRNFTGGPGDSSNRRVGFDVAARLSALHGTRVYYQLVFEDWRKRFHDALRFDADHIIGIDFLGLGPDRRHAVLVEYQEIGVRSHEHGQRTTGFTNGGRLAGSPLGPDARAFFVGARIDLTWATLSPWIEVARLSSDVYSFVEFGPISKVSEGPNETRLRLGTFFRLPLRRGLRIDADAVVERIDGFGFDSGSREWNVGGRATLVWNPGWTVGAAAARVN